MTTGGSIDFFDRQFRRQAECGDFALNPFEQATLPHLRGRMLDFGCGLGNLALAAARNGCTVLALDASPAAITALQTRAREESLPVEAMAADLRDHPLSGTYDSVVSIGLLAFFDCATARRLLLALRERVAPGGVLALNTLIEGTTWREAFTESSNCLLGEGELRQCVAGWTVLLDETSEFPAAGSHKRFATVIARRPGGT